MSLARVRLAQDLQHAGTRALNLTLYLYKKKREESSIYITQSF